MRLRPGAQASMITMVLSWSVLGGSVLGGLALAGPIGPATPAMAAGKDPALAAKLATVMKDSRVTKGRTAVSVYDTTLKAEVYGRNPTAATIPASNTKIVTAVAAMHVLGPDYRFRTEVIRTGAVSKGVVQGRLYLKGYGDPTVRVADYTALARQIRAAGITKFTGELAVDGTWFDSQSYNPNWSRGYASDYYAAPISALTMSPNADYDAGTIFVQYKPGRKGAKATVTLVPEAASRFVKILNKTTTGGTSNTIKVSRTYGTDTITLTGSIPTGRPMVSRQITVGSPDLYAGAVLRTELGKVGIQIRGTIRATTPATGRKLIARDYSMPLSAMLSPFLKYSNNMHAEALTKTMSRVTGGKGTWSDGLAETKAYLKRRGVPMTGVTLVDGSGLSRATRLTPRALTSTLNAVRTEKWFGTFYAALPVAGNSTREIGGTLRSRMNGTRAANNAHAKTGTLTGVTGLSGYVRGRNGHLYAFSMLSNYTGSSPRPVENTLVVTLADWRG